MPARTKVPSYRLHKPSGQAVMTLSGRDIYLGPHGTRVSRDNYDRHLGEWLEAGRRRPPADDEGPTTVAELCVAYNNSDELKRSSHASEYRSVMKAWLRLYADLPVEDFGPLALKVVRSKIVEAGLKRKTVNGRIDQLRRIVKWGVGQEIVLADVLVALQAVPGLRKGETAAPESRKVRGVAVEHVEACIGAMSPMLADMVMLQLHSGMRAAELCQLRAGDVKTGGKVWTYTPATHKTESHGHTREIEFGPKAIEILKRWLLPDLAAVVFSPIRAEADRLAAMHATRKTPLHLGNRPGTNKAKKPRRPKGDRYTTASYRRAIERAVDRTFPPPAEFHRLKGEDHKAWQKRLGAEGWSKLQADRKQYRWTPHRVRHTFGQQVRDQFGLEHAQRALGHSRAATTEIYAAAAKEKAVEVAAAMG